MKRPHVSDPPTRRDLVEMNLYVKRLGQSGDDTEVQAELESYARILSGMQGNLEFRELGDIAKEVGKIVSLAFANIR